MAVREFDGTNDYIRLSPGTLGPLYSGAITVACIAKIAANTSYRPVLAFDAGGAAGTDTRRSPARYSSSSNLGFDNNGGEFTVGLNWVIANDWCLIAWTKAAGSVAVRGHKYIYATDTWSHIDGGSAGNATGTLGNIKIGQWYNGADWFSGRMALVGVWGRVLSDAELVGMTDTLSQWEAEAPDALWPLNQDATTTAVADITGNGANQTLLAGTNVVVGDDPPFSFGGAPSTGTAAFSYNLFLDASGRRDSAGAAALSYNVDLDTAGARASQGTAAFSYNLFQGASGSRDPVGTAAFSYNLFQGASGSRDSMGTAAFGYNFKLDASGRRDSAGSADFSYDLDLSGTGARSSAGTAAFRFDLDLDAAGQRDSAGTASYTYGLQLGGTGSRDSAGIGLFGYNLTFSSTSGNQPAVGQAGLSYNLKLDAAGSRISQGSATFSYGLGLSGGGDQPATGTAAFSFNIQLAAGGFEERLRGVTGTAQVLGLTGSTKVLSLTGTAS